jgi:hypothetical protein
MAAVATLTPTATPVFGCNGGTADSISASSNSTFITMNLTNPNDSFTVNSIQLIWDPGNSKNKKTLTQAQLGSYVWTGNDSSGNVTITPTSLTLPGNNAESTVLFTLNDKYSNSAGVTITINLSSTLCGPFSVSKTR